MVSGAHPAEIDSALRGALLTDEELGRPGEWSQYPDPFGDWHADPCEALPDVRDELTARPNHHRDGER